MSSDSSGPELYDAIYGTFKDYVAESAAIASMVRAAHPRARTILDVGCGTGEHAKQLRESHGFNVDGLDKDAGMLAVARRKLPAARFHETDMAAFELGRRYDVVMCLFSSIGYLRTLPRVSDALRCFREHMVDDGVIIVEPWFAPGALRVGNGTVNHAEAGGVHVERRSHIEVTGALSILTFDYRIEDASGVRNVREVHELCLFTPGEMLACFREAGLKAAYDPVGLSNRGMYVARTTQ
ncbi:MAG: class I SAM-dependent methyltransferase [Gemmatimonas sp.]